MRRKSKLFGRWQQRCGLSLSILQQHVLETLLVQIQHVGLLQHDAYSVSLHVAVNGTAYAANKP